MKVPSRSPKKVVFAVLSVLASTFILFAIGFYVAVFVLTPAQIRDPKPEHLHFRMQLIVEGKDTDFSQQKFQEAYTPGACSFAITETPIHFHDGVDQVVHIHWKNLTGGQVLKYYGIDLVENPLMTSTLGFSFEDSKQIIPKNNKIWGRMFGDTDKRIKSNELKLFIYSGEKDNFSKKDTDIFLKQNLEAFFEKKSLVSNFESTQKFDLSSLFSVKAEAHGSAKIPEFKKSIADSNSNSRTTNTPTTTNSTEEYTEEELKEINNLIGNVVIFIQKDEPTNDQVKAKFDNLVPLKPSVCGG